MDARRGGRGQQKFGWLDLELVLDLDLVLDLVLVLELELELELEIPRYVNIIVQSGDLVLPTMPGMR